MRQMIMLQMLLQQMILLPAMRQMLLLWLESITREQIIHQSPTNDSTKYIKEKFWYYLTNRWAQS